MLCERVMQDCVKGFHTPNSSQIKKHKVTTISPKLQIPPSPFMKCLGFGTGVNVYLVQRSPKCGQQRSPWALKKISSRCSEDKNEYLRRLKYEAEILRELKHENIVSFRSCIQTNDGNCALAMEAGQKSLFSMVEERLEEEQGPFPAWSVMETACQLAEALRYLHHEMHILHGDLKSGNVLVQGNFKLVKLCDFGVSLRLNDDLIARNDSYVGTESWSAREVSQDGFVSNKADIYSYAMTLYEMLTLGIPHMHVFPEEESFGDKEAFESAWEAAEIEHQACLGTRPPLLEFKYDIAYCPAIEVFWVCSSERPRDRPSAQLLVECLAASRNNPTLPDPTMKLEF